MVVVISPLISLMIDQVSKLSGKGVKATYVRTTISTEEETSIRNGEYQIIYMSPETLVNILGWREMFLSELYQKHLVCIAVDEAHLVDKW